MFLIAYSGVHDNSRLKEWFVDVDMGVGLSGHVNQVCDSGSTRIERMFIVIDCSMALLPKLFPLISIFYLFRLGL
jgi:hypothetical protein